MTTARIILCIISVAGALGAIAYLIWMLLDWRDARDRGLLNGRLSNAWKSRMRQSIGLAVMLICLAGISLSSILLPDAFALRYFLLLIIALVADYKVWKLITDRFDADVQVRLYNQDSE